MPLKTKLLWSMVPITAFVAGIGANQLFPLTFNDPLVVTCENGELLRYDRKRERLIFVAFKDVVMNVKGDAYEVGDQIYAKATVSNEEAVNWVYDTKKMTLRRVFMNTKGQLTQADEAKCEHYSADDETDSGAEEPRKTA